MNMHRGRERGELWSNLRRLPRESAVLPEDQSIK
jgi:hypothetical protein